MARTAGDLLDVDVGGALYHGDAVVPGPNCNFGDLHVV